MRLYRHITGFGCFGNNGETFFGVLKEKRFELRLRNIRSADDDGVVKFVYPFFLERLVQFRFRLFYIVLVNSGFDDEQHLPFPDLCTGKNFMSSCCSSSFSARESSPVTSMPAGLFTAITFLS